MLFLFGMRCRFFGGYYVLKPGRANRLDPYCAGGVRIFNAFPAQAVIYGRNHPCGDKHSDELDVPCYLQVFGLEVGCDASCPSTIRVYDSERSKDAVTLRPRYNSLNQYSLRNMKLRWGALVSNTCFAGIRKVTSHSERNSIILASSLGRMFWTALSAGSISGTCAVVGTPTLRLTYSSAKKSRHILETHWLGFSMSIVIFARGHDQAA